MKNLKKVLSLALAFAMVLGLCIGASAADVTTLNDWDEVENKDAATLLGAFEIMKGDTDGNFRPNDNVTRAETAKMISVALWGGSDDVSLYNAGNIGGYTDVVAGSWYMGYVNYMTVQSIVTGKGEGIFDPNGNVTGYELLKMCLVSLGYSPETEGMTGAGWDVRTMALATKPGFQNLTAKTSVTNWNAPLTRTNAAQIIANMIWRETVIYSLTSGVGGNATSRVTGTGSTFAQTVLGMTPRTGTIVANEYGNTGSTTIDKEAKNYNGENTIVSIKPTMKADGQTSNNDGFTKNIVMESTAADVGATISAFVVGKDTIVSASIVPSEEVTPKFDENGALSNTNKEKNFTLTVSINGETQGKTESTLTNDGAEHIYTVENGKMTVDNDAEVSFIDTDGDGYINTVKAFKYGIKTITKDDGKDKQGNEQYAGVASSAVLKSACDFTAVKGDKVAVATMKKGNCFDTNAQSYHGYVLETVEGKVTRAATNGATVYIDGVKYNNAKGGLTVGSEGTFHLYANGTVADFTGKAGAQVADTYAVIYGGKTTTIPGGSLTAGGADTYETKVAAILENGTVGEYTLAAVKVGYEYDTNKDDDNGDAIKATAFATIDATKVDVLTAAGQVTVTLPSDADESETAPTDINNKQLEDVGTNKNYLVKYTLDGNKITITDPVEIGVAGLAASGFDGKVTVSGKTITSKTIGFVQTAADGEDEKWAVTVGTDLAGKVDSTKSGNVSVVYGNLFKTDGTNDELAVTYMVITNGLIKSETKTSDLYYVLVAPEITAVESGKNTYVATVFNGSTGKVEELTWKGTSTNVKAGEKYTKFDETNGLTAALAHNKQGFINGIVDKTLVNVIGDDNAQVGTYTLTKDTKYYLIDGENSKTITVDDLATQTVVNDNENKTEYQVEVVVAMNGTGDSATETTTATMVILYADVQTAE